MLDSVTLVNQFDSKYWRWCIEWNGFFDAVNEVSPSSIVGSGETWGNQRGICSSTHGLGNDPEGKIIG